MTEYGLIARATGEMLALRGVTVSAQIDGLLASTTLIQSYRNDTGKNLELSYTFPLPVSGTLLSFSVAIGERKYEGRVIPRTQAETEYEQAIGEGHTAFRLQELRAGIYNATLGNVMPGESVEITITYAQPLAWNGKSIRYRLPTTIAPRYGAPSGLQPWQRPETKLATEYFLNLTVLISAALSQSAVSCASHQVSMRLQSDGVCVQLLKGASLDRDFILEIETAEVRSLGTIASAIDTHVAMLSLLPPEVDSQDYGRDVVLVIDCSGSMQGDSLKLAKEGIRLALGSLSASERFGLVAFGTSFLQFDKELQPANRKNLDMARRWVNDLADLGGTDIDGALDLALTLKGKQPMDVLLLTDGQDWHVGESVQNAKAQGVRIFSMGIGSAVAEDCVQMMADETAGACELVTPTEDMSERIYRHFKRMRQPRLANLEIAWPAKPLWEYRPARACFAGDSCTVFAAVSAPSAQDVVVRFDFEGQQRQELVVPLNRAGAASSDAIVRLGAKHYMNAIAEENRQAWAITYQLMTADTDYLITVERTADERANELPELQVQAQMLPAGWGGTSSVVMNRLANRDIRLSPAIRSPMADSIYASAIDFSQNSVAPLVARMRMNPVKAMTNLFDNGYTKFIDSLNGASKDASSGNIPSTLQQLLQLPLPRALRKQLARLSAEGIDPTKLLHSFYSALLLHDGQTVLEETLRQLVADFVSSKELDDVLVGTLRESLDALWESRSNGGVSFDIPKFLRRSAE